MADKTSDDARLLYQARAGDASAFGVLYQRHVHAVRRLAREFVMSPAEADHLVSETFAVVHDVIQGGGGPTDAFRPYVLSALRKVAADQLRDRRVPTATHLDLGEPLAATMTADSADSHVVRAFLALPERWRAVLWHTDIEEEPAAEVAPLLGVSPDDVAGLRRRARHGLRQAIVRVHLAHATGPDCRMVTDRLGDYRRGALASADWSAVTAHLSLCADCAAASAALAGITAALRDEVAPVFLGGAALPYLLRERHVTAGEAEAPAASDTRDFGAVRRGSAASLLRRVPGKAWIGTAAVLAAGVIGAVALTAAGAPHHPATPRQIAAPDQSRGATASTGPQPGRTPTPSARPSATPTSRPPAPPTSAPPAVRLTAALSVKGGTGRNQVAIQVNDTGSAATGQLAATVTLPAGSVYVGVAHQGNSTQGWTCQASSNGATCQHAAISTGTSAAGTILVATGGRACGQPVRFSVRSGNVSASAEPQDIQCR